MSYIITTLCFGQKYKPIKSHWLDRIEKTCKKKKRLLFFDETNIRKDEVPNMEYAWWDLVRLKKNIHLSLTENIPIVHVDMDIIVEKDLEEIINLPYDFIISTEIGGNQSFPKECSQKLGFGLCSGFYVIKKTGIEFMKKMLHNMINKKYNSLSDQVNIMNYIVSNNYTVKDEVCFLNGVEFKNKIIEIDNIKICVLDFDIIIRDPIFQKQQFGNHINIDNVGGVNNFISYFYNPLENLPLTCRCGKSYLGDNTVCKHIAMRQKI